MPEVPSDFDIEIVEVCVKHEVVPESVLRNMRIRKDFHALRAAGKMAKEILIILSEKYFLSEKSIDAIVYQTSGMGKKHRLKK